jgi:hypothetical protein
MSLIAPLEFALFEYTPFVDQRLRELRKNRYVRGAGGGL